MAASSCAGTHAGSPTARRPRATGNCKWHSKICRRSTPHESARPVGGRRGYAPPPPQRALHHFEDTSTLQISGHFYFAYTAATEHKRQYSKPGSSMLEVKSAFRPGISPSSQIILTSSIESLEARKKLQPFQNCIFLRQRLSLKLTL